VPKVAVALANDEVAGEREAARAREHVADRGAQHGLAEPADELEQARESARCPRACARREAGGRRPRSREVGRRGEDRRVVDASGDEGTAPVVAGRGERGEQSSPQKRGRQRCGVSGSSSADSRDDTVATS